MKTSGAILFAFLCLSPAVLPALPVEVGLTTSGGLCFTAGSYLDARAADLALQGATGATMGSSRTLLFPGISAGAFTEVGILPWLDLRAEIRASYLGASRLASTGAGAPLDAYSIGYYTIMVPILARAVFPAGPGRVAIGAGPLYALVVGGIQVSDAYPGITSTTNVPTSFTDGSMFGITADVGYDVTLGPGILGVAVHVDALLSPGTLTTSLASGSIMPLATTISVTYGLVFGGGR